MAGRRPKPTHLRLLQGNPGKRPFNPNEPKPKAEMPSIPEHLSETAAKEWVRVSEQLLRLGLLTAVDRAAFAAYCTVYARWADAEEALKKTGPVVRSPSGYPMISPYLIVANRALDQMRQYLIEFGLTPASRSRISVGMAEQHDSVEDFLFGQN
jgi:P27 family predicted phage terminase small subunit